LSLGGHESTVKIVEAPFMLLQPSNTNDPFFILPVGVISLLPTEQLSHASRGIVITLEADGDPMRIDKFSVTDRELVHAVHPFLFSTASKHFGNLTSTNANPQSRFVISLSN
jgi:hypothetical protein